MSTVLDIKVDCQSDKAATIIGQLLTALAMVYWPSRNFSESRVWEKIPEGRNFFITQCKIGRG